MITEITPTLIKDSPIADLMAGNHFPMQSFKYNEKTGAVKSGRSLVMHICKMTVDDPDDRFWVVYPYFGGSFTVAADDVTEAVSRGMIYFRCFIDAPYTFRKL